MRCWSCGIEPTDVYEVIAMDRADAVATLVRWPAATDHEHAERPPTPDEMIEAGDVALLNIRAEWAR